jgi:hypothetical protein
MTEQIKSRPATAARPGPTAGKVEVHSHRLSTMVLSGVGAFLVLAGLMVHFYALPKLAIAPIDQSSITSLEASGATLFDTGTLKPITTDLSVKARTVGDVTASKKAPGDTRVWVNTTTVKSSDGVVRSQSIQRKAFDGKTAEAVNCCGAFSETVQGERTPVTRSGLLFKWPFNTGKKTYQVWDDTLAKPVAATYDGSTSRDGITVYRFVSDVPASKVGTQDVPASVLGLPGTGNVTADSMYQNHLTYYVEPVTGAILDETQQQRTWFAAEGHELTTLQATLSYTDGSVKDTADQVRGKRVMLSLAQGWVPWAVVGLGAILLAAGVLRSRRQDA